MKSLKWTLVSTIALGAGLLSNMVAPPAAQAATLGTAQQAGPFTVTLIASPQLGPTRFEARVSRDGAYVTDAQVRLSLSMAGHKHGPALGRLNNVEVTAQGAQYAGTIKLPMPGTYDATLSVKAGGQKGSAIYQFKTSKSIENAHLGIWHPAGTFEVRLTTVPASPKAGENTFRVQVTREGQSVSGATVKLHLSMPAMRMAGDVDTPKLSPKDNAYEGTGNLAHAGNWQAHITVSANGVKGTAVYNFTAS